MWTTTPLTAASAAVMATFVTLTSAQGLNSPSSAANACPAVCNDEKDSWSVFNKVKRLQDCDQHMLLDFAIYNPLNEPSTTVKIRACTVPGGSNCAASSSSYSIFDKRDAVINSTALCVSDALPIDVSLDVAKSGDGSDLTFATADALTLLSTYMSSSCDLKQTFSYGLGSIVGVFSGAAVDNGGTVPYVLAEAIAIANNSDVGAPETMFVQRCVPEGSSKHIFGVAINNAGNLSWVQEAVKSWSNGVCLNASSLTSPETSTVSNITFYEYTHPAVGYTNLTVPSNSTTNNSSTSTLVSLISSSTISLTSTLSSSSIIRSTTKATSTTASSSTPAGVTPPGPTQTGIISTCNKYALPVSGEGCYDFAAANGITLDQFYAWNPAVGACANFWLGEAYCVGISAGTKRDASSPLELELELDKRSDCTTATVVSGDSCGSLATECGISGDQFTIYNPNICGSLTPGQRVCCSAGTLPDVTPKENSDGTCYAYTVKTGDSCSAIAASYDLTNAKIESFNKGTTWGWFGCTNLLADLKICLSTGIPPLPNSVQGAQCGPTVPGTVLPTNGTALADLNQCPLNACCDIWGQCGITPEYCTNDTGPEGNPGTAPAGKNGCISNCGTNITNSDIAPTQFISVGYYESWNWNRPCLNMRAAAIDTSAYTHIHWAFADISDDYNVVINDTFSQWADFKALSGVKRIVSFGGWGYSTDAATYNRLRVAMNPENFLTFVDNIILFLNNEGLDGVDFDWEYPGAPDIPGIPPGLATDGPNYFTFLGALRGKLGLDTTKSISFAAPASYWYLQHFPVKQMAGEADYIVYMTYDLHGQWDYGNVWSQEGCGNGNCLRSHVNLTETLYTLAMVTKAGVPTYKITVGISSYGRAFKMTQAGCTGPTCTYVGPDSAAAQGECTQTAGYISNAEIDEIIYANASSTSSWYDATTDSDYVVYNDTEWIAYMSESVKDSRKSRWQALNFAGTIDWAIDLMQFGDDDGNADGDCTGDDDCQPPDHPWTPCTDGPFGNFDDLSDDTIAGWPLHCRAQYTLESLGGLLKVAMANYTELMAEHYDSKFKVYAKAVSGNALSEIHDFMMNHGNDYFTCEVVEIVMCCSYCKGSGHENCEYCVEETCYASNKRDEPLQITDGREDMTVAANETASSKVLQARGDYNPNNNKHLVISWTNTSQPCPPDYSKRGYGPDNPYEQTLYWSLSADKSDKFYADILDATGVPKDNIGFGLYTDIDSCSGSGHKTGDGAECWNTGYEFNAPYANGYGVDQVTNPKDLVTAGLTNSANLPGQIESVLQSMRALAYPGDGFEIVDAVSLPIMMIVQGVESMQLVVQTADKIEAAERKAIMLAFITAILFFIPIAGEVLGAVAGAGEIAGIIALLGAAGNVAFDVYTIVDDPSNAPLAIVDLIFAPLALSDVAIIAKAASIKRGMTAEQMVKLGDRVGERMGKLKKVTGTCAK